MTKQQPRRDEKAELVPLNLYPQTIEQLAEVQRAFGESRAAVVRRLVEHETSRLRREGIPRAPVWTFPGHRASGARIDARVVFHPSGGGEPRAFDAEGDRLRPEPPRGSYILIGEGSDQLRGQLEIAETVDIDGTATLVLDVREIVSVPGRDAPPVLFDFVRSLDDLVRVHSSAAIIFDPFRTTPSWKTDDNEVRAMLVGLPGQRARMVRFFPFSGPDRLNPVSDHFPLVPIDDDVARDDAAQRIATFLEKGPANAVAPDPEALYQHWANVVYLLVHDRLGGDDSQTGLSRRFGKGTFTISTDYKPAGDLGIVQVIVHVANGPSRRRRVHRYEWRTMPAFTVAADAVKSYLDLLED